MSLVGIQSVVSSAGRNMWFITTNEQHRAGIYLRIAQGIARLVTVATFARCMTGWPGRYYTQSIFEIPPHNLVYYKRVCSASDSADGQTLCALQIIISVVLYCVLSVGKQFQFWRLNRRYKRVKHYDHAFPNIILSYQLLVFNTTRILNRLLRVGLFSLYSKNFNENDVCLLFCLSVWLSSDITCTDKYAKIIMHFCNGVLNVTLCVSSVRIFSWMHVLDWYSIDIRTFARRFVNLQYPV